MGWIVRSLIPILTVLGPFSVGASEESPLLISFTYRLDRSNCDDRHESHCAELFVVGVPHRQQSTVTLDDDKADMIYKSISGKIWGQILDSTLHKRYTLKITIYIDNEYTFVI
jgi:hypothetical protein